MTETLVERARYVDGRNNSDRAVVADVLSSTGLSKAARRIVSPDPELIAAYQDRIAAILAAIMTTALAFAAGENALDISV